MNLFVPVSRLASAHTPRAMARRSQPASFILLLVVMAGHAVVTPVVLLLSSVRDHQSCCSIMYMVFSIFSIAGSYELVQLFHIWVIDVSVTSDKILR